MLSITTETLPPGAVDDYLKLQETGFPDWDTAELIEARLAYVGALTDPTYDGQSRQNALEAYADHFSAQETAARADHKCLVLDICREVDTVAIEGLRRTSKSMRVEVPTLRAIDSNVWMSIRETYDKENKAMLRMQAISTALKVLVTAIAVAEA